MGDIRISISEIPELKQDGVHMKDPVRVEYLLNKLISGGPKKLQVIADFDHTITKQHINGVRHESSFCMFNHCEGLPSDFQARDRTIVNKYVPIERDPSLPRDKKLPFMIEFYELTSDLYTGFKFDLEEINRAVARTQTELRTGTASLVSTLEAEDIPFLVFSAGLGDIVQAVLHHHRVDNKNIHIISNFLRLDDEGKLNGFQDDMVHPLNKNGLAASHTQYFSLMSSRSSVILMGDSLGDADMADGVPNTDAVLKIGFLYGDVEKNLPAYLEHFDVVLVNDQTMDLANALVKKILNSK